MRPAKKPPIMAATTNMTNARFIPWTPFRGSRPVFWAMLGVSGAASNDRGQGARSSPARRDQRRGKGIQVYTAHVSPTWVPFPAALRCTVAGDDMEAVTARLFGMPRDLAETLNS